MSKVVPKSIIKNKSPLEIIEKKYGKEPSVVSNTAIRVFLKKRGYKSLSRLLEID